MDDLKILIQSKLDKNSQKSLNEQIQLLKIKAIKVPATLANDVSKTINTQLQSLKLKSLNLSVNVNGQSIKSAIQNAQNATKGVKSSQLEIFNIDKLDKEGRKYYLSATNIIDRIKKEFQNSGDINIVDTRNAKKQITGFTVEIRKLSGEIEKLNFKKAQFLKQGWGSKQSGFVFEKSSDTDKLLGTDLQKKLDVLNRFNNALATAKQRAFDLTKPISNQTHIDSLNKRYEAIKTEIDKVRLSGEAMSKSQQRHIANMIASADRLRKKYQELERPAKVLESKTLEQTMAGYKSRFSVDEERWRQQGILVGDFQKRVEALKVEMSTVGSKTDLHKFQTELESVKAEAKKLNLETRQFNKETAQMTSRDKLTTYLNQNPKAFKNNVEGFTKLRDSIKDIDTVTKQSQFNTEFTRLKANVEALGKSGNTVLGSLAANMKKFFGWFLASGGVMSAIYTLRKMVSNVISLDKALVNLQMATGGSRSDTKELLNTYTELGKRLGSTTQEIADAGNAWLRQGMSIADTNKMIENSMILSKIGMLSSAEATEYLTSSMKGYGVAVEDTIKIVDMLSAVDLKSATDAGGLALAMSRTAASAQIAGVQMSKLISYIATISEVTQKESSSIGESLKTIFARMRDIKLGKDIDEEGESLSNVESVLADLDIKLRDSVSSFRNFGDVIDEVGKNWNSYSSVQQAEIAKAFSGRQALCLNM